MRRAEKPVRSAGNWGSARLPITWKRQYAGLGVQQLHELREENSRLKRIVADLTLDRQILQEVVSKKL
jgi:hypothetical protein